jgi:hypothetical protein
MEWVFRSGFCPNCIKSRTVYCRFPGNRWGIAGSSPIELLGARWTSIQKRTSSKMLTCVSHSEARMAAATRGNKCAEWPNNCMVYVTTFSSRESIIWSANEPRVVNSHIQKVTLRLFQIISIVIIHPQIEGESCLEEANARM